MTQALATTNNETGLQVKVDDKLTVTVTKEDLTGLSLSEREIVRNMQGKKLYELTEQELSQKIDTALIHAVARVGNKNIEDEIGVVIMSDMLRLCQTSLAGLHENEIGLIFQRGSSGEWGEIKGLTSEKVHGWVRKYSEERVRSLSALKKAENRKLEQSKRPPSEDRPALELVQNAYEAWYKNPEAAAITFCYKAMWKLGYISKTPEQRWDDLILAKDLMLEQLKSQSVAFRNASKSEIEAIKAVHRGCDLKTIPERLLVKFRRNMVNAVFVKWRTGGTPW